MTQMIQLVNSSLKNNVKFKVIIVTKPIEEYKEKDRPVVINTLELLKNEGFIVVHKPNIHQRFAVIDKGIVWYGSINLLSYGGYEDSIMRLESSNISDELINSLQVDEVEN